MDFLNQGYARLVDLFKSMTPGARITAGLLLSMVVISLAYLVNHASTGQETFLMGGEPFSAAQLPSMEAAFSKAGLNDYKIEGNRIRVPLGKQASYMGALADGAALPAGFGAFLEKAVNASPWISKKQRDEANKIAKQIELQSIICHMQGIESASVMYDIDAPKSFGQDRVATASVSVKPQGNLQLDENQVRNCRNLVAAAIAGMKPQNVTVTDLNGRSYAGKGSTDSLGSGDEDAYITRKTLYEKQWNEKIATALSSIPGVIVASDVELDPETTHEESSTDFDPKTVPYQQSEDSLTKTVRAAGGGGRPGPAQQHGVNQPATVSTASGSDNSEESNRTQTQNAVSTKQTRIVHSALTPRRVKVNISIPSNYYEAVWAVQNPTLPGQEAKKPDANAIKDIESKVKTDVQAAVVALTPTFSTTADPLPRVTVTTFQHLPSMALVGPTLPDKALAWAGQYWSTLGLMGLALMSMVMLRSMVRQAPAAASATSSFNVVQSPDDAIDAAEPTSGEAEPQNIRSRLKRRPPGGPSLRDELSELVKEDPDAAVTVLRSWIGNAS